MRDVLHNLLILGNWFWEQIFTVESVVTWPLSGDLSSEIMKGRAFNSSNLTAISEEAQIKGTKRRLAALICTCGYTINEMWKSVLLLHNNLNLHPPTQRCFYVRSWTALCRNTCISSGEACDYAAGQLAQSENPVSRWSEPELNMWRRSEQPGRDRKNSLNDDNANRSLLLLLGRFFLNV